MVQAPQRRGARAAGRGVSVSTPPHLAPKGMLTPGFGDMSEFLQGVHIVGDMLSHKVCMCSYSFNSHSHQRHVRVLVPSQPWQGLCYQSRGSMDTPWVSGCWPTLLLLDWPVVMVS